ncbi:MAG: NusG domain II-containing protein [Oscillospiraceae bacterium]|nr:NusG domain II-containing protein [Oscillospiraceae bacterium]
MKKRKNDVMLIAAVILAAALIWVFTLVTQNEGAFAVVTVDGEVYGTYPLDTDAEIRIGDDDHYNVLVIKDGTAEITEASCPDKLCVKQGKAEYDGQSIICLPNKVVVEIKGGKKSDYDAVVK